MIPLLNHKLGQTLIQQCDSPHHAGEIEKISHGPLDTADGYQGRGGSEYGLMQQLGANNAREADQSTLIEHAIEEHLIGFKAEETQRRPTPTRPLAFLGIHCDRAHTCESLDAA
ncbi:MAG: hypothetical protein ABGY95_11125 [Rubritalea sp.]